MTKLYLQGFEKLFLCFSTSGGSRPSIDYGRINQLDACVTSLSLFSSVSLYKGGDEGPWDLFR